MALPYQWQMRVDRLKNTFRGFFGGDPQPRPKLCPACGSLVGINTTRCHNCGANMRFSLAALSKKLSGLIDSHAPITTVLLIVNFLMFAVSLMFAMQAGEAGGLSILWGMGGEVSYRLGASFGYSIFYQREWWRLITAMFLHGGLIHIGVNMMSLFQFGPALEEVYGSPRFLFVYVLTGMAGFLLSALTGHFSLGASGALLGLDGAILAITYKRGGRYLTELRSRLIVSIVILFAIGWWGGIRIDNEAHFGGLVTGFIFGKIFADRQPMNPAEKQRAYIMGWLAGLAVVASFALMILHFRDPLPGQ